MTHLTYDRMKYLERRLTILLNAAKAIGHNVEDANDIADAFLELTIAVPHLAAMEKAPYGLDRLRNFFHE
jgi:hypothetical protein